MNSQAPAIPVGVSKLVIGEIYFIINYLDKDMLVPDMQGVVFIGRDLDCQASGTLYFQDVTTYAASYPPAPGVPTQGEIYQCTEDQLQGIYDLEEATKALRRCCARRVGHRTGTYRFLLSSTF